MSATDILRELPRKRVRINLKRLANGDWQPEGTVELETIGRNEDIEYELDRLCELLDRVTGRAIAARQAAAKELAA